MFALFLLFVVLGCGVPVLRVVCLPVLAVLAVGGCLVVCWALLLSGSGFLLGLLGLVLLVRVFAG